MNVICALMTIVTIVMLIFMCYGLIVCVCVCLFYYSSCIICLMDRLIAIDGTIQTNGNNWTSGHGVQLIRTNPIINRLNGWPHNYGTHVTALWFNAMGDMSFHFFGQVCACVWQLQVSVTNATKNTIEHSIQSRVQWAIQLLRFEWFE